MNNNNHNKNKYIYMYGPAIMINLKEKKNECASSEIYMQQTMNSIPRYLYKHNRKATITIVLTRRWFDRNNKMKYIASFIYESNALVSCR